MKHAGPEALRALEPLLVEIRKRAALVGRPVAHGDVESYARLRIREDGGGANMVRGSCLCGGIQFEVTNIPLIVLCHCSMCRKANGSAFDVGATIPPNDFRFVKGAELIQAYESSPGIRRAFCRVCGSRMPWQAPDGSHYWVPMGAIEGDPAARPAMHVFVGSKAPWWEIHDELPQFEKFPPGYEPENAK